MIQITDEMGDKDNAFTHKHYLNVKRAFGAPVRKEIKSSTLDFIGDVITIFILAIIVFLLLIGLGTIIFVVIIEIIRTRIL